jgi:repressor of nif and glnA expression
VLERIGRAYGLPAVAFILRTLVEYKECGQKLGRVRLVKQARGNGYDITEDRMRSMLGLLERNGVVKVGQTRQGTIITPFGERVLAEIRGRA